MKILFFLCYLIISVQFTVVIPNGFIEFSFAPMKTIGSHFCEPFSFCKQKFNLYKQKISTKKHIP